MTNQFRNAAQPRLEATIPTTISTIRMTFIQSVPFRTPISFGVFDR
jgi:hypothetical protein